LAVSISGLLLSRSAIVHNPTKVDQLDFPALSEIWIVFGDALGHVKRKIAPKGFSLFSMLTAVGGEPLVSSGLWMTVIYKALLDITFSDRNSAWS